MTTFTFTFIACLAIVTTLGYAIPQTVAYTRRYRQSMRERAAFAARQDAAIEALIAALQAGDKDLADSIRVDADIDAQRFFEKHPPRY